MAWHFQPINTNGYCQSYDSVAFKRAGWSTFLDCLEELPRLKDICIDHCKEDRFNILWKSSVEAGLDDVFIGQRRRLHYAKKPITSDDVKEIKGRFVVENGEFISEVAMMRTAAVRAELERAAAANSDDDDDDPDFATDEADSDGEGDEVDSSDDSNWEGA